MTSSLRTVLATGSLAAVVLGLTGVTGRAGAGLPVEVPLGAVAAQQTAEAVALAQEAYKTILSRTPDSTEGRGKYLSVAWIGNNVEGGRAIGTWAGASALTTAPPGRTMSTRTRVGVTVAWLR